MKTRMITTNRNRQRKLVVLLAALVVFVVSYLLILPAITLDQNSAQKQGGVDLPSANVQETAQPAAKETAQQGNSETAQPPGSAQDKDKAAAREDGQSPGGDAESGNPESGKSGGEQKSEAPGNEAPGNTENDETSGQNPSGAESAGPSETPDTNGNTDKDSEADAANAAETAETEEAEGQEASGNTYEKAVMTADGKSWHITVTAGEDAMVPAGAELEVSEITKKSDEDVPLDYEEYVAKAEKALGWDSGSATYIRLFDISIVDENKDKVEIQAPVDVKIRLADKEDGGESGKETRVVHFADDAKKAEAVRPEVVKKVRSNGSMVSFEAEGFSAYAIVEGPEPVSPEWTDITTMDEFRAYAEQGIYVGNLGVPKLDPLSPFYFLNEPYSVPNNTSRKGILKTADPTQAVKYYFEPVEGTTDQFYAYCYDNQNNKQYVRNTGNNSLLLTTTESEKTAFTITAEGGDYHDFTVSRPSGNTTWYWNMQGDNNGKGFASYNRNNDGSKMHFWYSEESETDPYGLDGKSYGLMSWNGGVAGRAMMAETSGGNLEAKALTVMSEADDYTEKLFVPNDSDISMWKFQWVGGDNYYLTVDAGGSTKYLKVESGQISLADTPDDSCKIRVIPGTGAHKGEISLKQGNTAITYSGNIDTGFNTGGSAGSEWLHFTELSELTADHVMTYTASKISVSDPSVTNGSSIIVYTRVWDTEENKYKYYAVDADGSLVRVYESGNSIQWVGNRINTMLWDFVEHYDAGTQDPNYYYELYNPSSGNYIAPKDTEEGGQILQDSPIGINLDGRKKGKYYTTILAWDDDSYAYTGLKVENNRVVPCPKSEAGDFYFAVIQEPSADDELSTVTTVDNNKYGITMKMKDFESGTEMNTFMGSNAGGAGVPPTQGLLSTNLDANGYPVTTKQNSGGSLGTMFSGSKDVNHLFIQSTYDATGYFEFDSSQNFASLKGKKEGDFTVYKELGSYDISKRPTLQHGQFFPYNDISAGLYTTLNTENLYTAEAHPLSDSDPRKHEKLHKIVDENCYFGMELEAGFTQTPSGKDDWGHDIIFEFTGDDDFWLYVDGELVIDLGGIHSALPGWVNFSTGEVSVNGRSTTLRDLFFNNYKSRGHTDAQAQEYVDGIFEQNSDGKWVFKDYSPHTMRIFFMERGAGASNLHMKFNLASVKPGKVLLSKELSGAAETAESPLAVFPYQIYVMKPDAQGGEPQEHLLAKGEEGFSVCYQDTIRDVTYKNSLEVGGTTYQNVFLLKAGEAAEITIPDDAISYRIVECGVDTNVYDGVQVNEEDVTGVSRGNHRKDYGIGWATSRDRPKVAYSNKVNEHALRILSFTKKLYDETGEHELRNDSAVFDFRLYFGTEFDTDLSAADMHVYYVKDPNRNYCRWDKASKKFVSTGKKNFNELTDAEKEAIGFVSSMNGSISGIPPFYTVEVREVLAGTRFKVEERADEIPDGYSLQGYTLYSNWHEHGNSEHGNHGTETETNQGMVTSGENPHVEVRNLKGWGLRVNKVWSDGDYMEDRDPTYFAVYREDGSHDPVLVDGTVRQLSYGKDSLYWYFQRLPQTGSTLEQYKIREVTVTDPVVDEDGKVTDYSQITLIGDGETVTLDGTLKGETDAAELDYTVQYEEGTVEPGSNVREDTVTNSRPGIVLKKTDWNGQPMKGAEFTLKDNEGNAVGTFTSDETGKISEAYLKKDTDYTLTEIKTPQGYHGLDNAVRISQNAAGEVAVSGPDSEEYVLTQASGSEPASVTIKNRPLSLKFVKINDSDQPLQGVHFQLHREVTINGVTTMEFDPMEGYEDLVSSEGGVIAGVDQTLLAGTYDLKEKATPAGYQPLDEPVRFTINKTGKVTLAKEGEARLTSEKKSDGTYSYKVEVINKRSDVMVPVKVKKVGYDNTDDSETPLAGIKFTVYEAEASGGSYRKGDEYADWTSAATTGLLFDGELPAGNYLLEEDASTVPDGYNGLGDMILLTVSEDGIEAQYMGTAGIGTVVRVDTEQQPPVVIIRNTTGVVLPNSGGPGTHWIYLLGTVLLLGAGTLLAARRRVRSS